MIRKVFFISHKKRNSFVHKAAEWCVEAYFADCHVGAELAFCLGLVQAAVKALINIGIYVCTVISHSCVRFGKVGDFDSPGGTEYKANITPFAIVVENRGIFRKIDAFHRAVINAQGALWIYALFHIDGMIQPVLFIFYCIEFAASDTQTAMHASF